MRAPEKRVFKIDIGNIPPQEVDNYMQKIINKMKKTPFVDKNTGDYNLKYNIQNLTEDFFLPVRGSDSGTSIDNFLHIVIHFLWWDITYINFEHSLFRCSHNTMD